MTTVRIEIGNGHPGARLYVRERRWHHGRTGEALCGAGLIATAAGAELVGSALIAVGALLMVHDRRDWPWPTVER